MVPSYHTNKWRVSLSVASVGIITICMDPHNRSIWFFSLGIYVPFIEKVRALLPRISVATEEFHIIGNTSYIKWILFYYRYVIEWRTT